MADDAAADEKKSAPLSFETFGALAAAAPAAVRRDDEEDEDGDDGEVAPSPDVHFEPVLKLEQVATRTCEEDEDVFFKVRAKLYRFDKGEWKERGTGDLKMLQHRESRRVRIVMRRDKTLKVCANHRVLPEMVLTANVGSDRSWVYTAPNDIGDDGAATCELLAVRFPTADAAAEFKDKFAAAQAINAKCEETKAAESTEKADASKEEKADASKDEKADASKETAPEAAKDDADVAALETKTEKLAVE